MTLGLYIHINKNSDSNTVILWENDIILCLLGNIMLFLFKFEKVFFLIAFQMKIQFGKNVKY